MHNSLCIKVYRISLVLLYLGLNSLRDNGAEIIVNPGSLAPLLASLDTLLSLSSLLGSLLLSLSLASAIELFGSNLCPWDLGKLATGSLEQVSMELGLAHHSALHKMAEEQVVVHGLGDDLGDLTVLEFEESEMLGGTSFLVARYTETGDLAELAKVAMEFFLVEPVRESTDVKGASWFGWSNFCLDKLAGLFLSDGLLLGNGLGDALGDLDGLDNLLDLFFDGCLSCHFAQPPVKTGFLAF